GDDAGQSRAVRELGQASLARDDHERARERFEQSLELAEAAGDATRRYGALQSLGELEREAGNRPRATALLAEALPLALEIHTGHAAAIEHSLGDLALADGDTAGAERRYSSALSAGRNLGHSRTVAYCLAGLAAVAAKRGEPQRAGRLW